MDKEHLKKSLLWWPEKQCVYKNKNKGLRFFDIKAKNKSYLAKKVWNIHSIEIRFYLDSMSSPFYLSQHSI